MIKEIITDANLLGSRCISSIGKEYEKIVCDLLDTAKHHETTGDCVGLAANQIGYNKRVFVALIDEEWVAFVNPSFIVKCGGVKSDYEKCLSFPGQREKVRRYKRVKLRYEDYFNKCEAALALKNFEARIVQHEMDHLNGVLI